MPTADDYRRMEEKLLLYCPRHKLAAQPLNGTFERLFQCAIHAEVVLVVQELVDLGIAPQVDHEGNTALHVAAPSPPLLAALLAQGLDVHARNVRGETPLHRACAAPARFFRSAAAYRESVDLLLARGVDVNVVSTTGETPLLTARDDVKATLLDRGALATAVTADGRTALHGVEDAALAKRLVDAGADARGAGAYLDRRTALHLTRDKGVATVLLDAGADANAKDATGKTPLHEFSRRGPADLVRLLAKRRANVDASDDDGNTPLHLVEETLVRAVLGAGAGVAIKNAAGRTALAECLRRWGASGAKWETHGAKAVEAFLDAGADPNARDAEGRTPLHEAMAHVKKEAIPRLLIAKGGDLTIRDGTGATPLELLARRPRVAKLVAALTP